MYLVHVKGKKTAEASTFTEAGRLVREAWANGRASAFCADRTAGLVEEAGVVVAHVSFNGRVWQGADRFSVSQEILS